jgi:hypothetical protein
MINRILGFRSRKLGETFALSSAASTIASVTFIALPSIAIGELADFVADGMVHLSIVGSFVCIAETSDAVSGRARARIGVVAVSERPSLVAGHVREGAARGDQG